MNWSDVKNDAIEVPNIIKANYDEEWINAEHEIENIMGIGK